MALLNQISVFRILSLSLSLSLTTDTPSVADAANTSVDGVSAAAAAIIHLTILPMSAVRTLSSAHCVVPESACSSTSLRWNSRTA